MVSSADNCGSVRSGVLRDHVLGQLHQRLQRFPAGARLGTRRLLVGESEFAENRAHDVDGRDTGLDLAAGNRGDLTHRLPDLGAGEEGLTAAYLVRDPGLGQRLLVVLRLGVDAVEDRDLGR